MDGFIELGVFVTSLGASYYLYQSACAKRDKTRFDAYNQAVDNYLVRRESLVNSLVSQGKSLQDISKNIEDLVGIDYPSPDDFDL
ncbi:Uncharacterised protein [uncultured archaeon]|nr:Uncharacterised protein [uncultured archaeon]